VVEAGVGLLRKGTPNFVSRCLTTHVRWVPLSPQHGASSVCGWKGRYCRKARGKKPLGRPRRRWMDKIKTDLLEIG
jgi:hypothetical protein